MRASAVDAAEDGFETIVLDDLTRPVMPGNATRTNAEWARSGVKVMDSTSAD